MHYKGEIVGNRYRIIQTLRRGGMSIIYLVEDNRLDHRWVLKEFNFSGNDDSEQSKLEAHFLSEAKICAKFSHPGIPRVIDYFSIKNRHYLVEEYIEGKTLLEIIESGEIKPENIIPIAVRLCSVLEYIHEKGIVYRDLKPDNIMIDGENHLKLVDFGIARIYKPSRANDTIAVGTPGYAAPEQYGGGQTDSRSDIYSLGALLHHMITGINPANKPFNFDPPSSIGINIHPVLERIIMKSLSLKPEERFESVAKIRQALDSINQNAVIIKTEDISNNITKKIDTGLEDALAKEDKAEGRTNQKSFNKILTLIYFLVVFLLFALLFESGFKLWILIPYVIIAWLVSASVLKAWGKHFPEK